MIDRLKAWFRKPDPITDIADLSGFLGQRTAFIAQKSTFEYCRMRAGLQWDKLFLEKAFVDGIERAQWVAFDSVLRSLITNADTMFVQQNLRIAPDSRLEFWRGIAADCVAMHPPPPAYADLMAATPDHVVDRLRQQLASTPLPPDDVAVEAGAVIFDVLPIHMEHRQLDRDMVVNNVRLNVMRTHEDLRDRLNTEKMQAALDSIAPAPVA